MQTYLLTWNPDRWRWHDLDDQLRHLLAYGHADDDWSCGVTKSIRSGDRVFLMRLGSDPKGIVASGYVTREWFAAPHYDPARAARGDTALRVGVRWDTLTAPATDPPLPHALLDHALPYTHYRPWSPFASGRLIPADTAARLEELWTAYTGGDLPPLPEEVPDGTTYREGAVRQVTVNAYERNDAARRACIAYHGVCCAICGFDFAATYGPVGAGLIHVHHRRPLASIGRGYVVDPIADLIPVCPNCHAIIHRRSEPYTVDEVRAYLTATSSAQNTIG